MLAVPPGVPGDQTIVVTARHWSSTHATLRAFERRTDGWRPVTGPVPARVGANGLVPAGERRQSTGTTPTGTFTLPAAYGRAANPGTRMPYTQFDRNDVWTYNPARPSTYNLFQSADRRWHYPGTYIEHLWNYGRAYKYFAVIGFNLPSDVTQVNGVRRAQQPADTRRGGGIFLHVTDGTPTAGCVAVPAGAMREVLRWLRPGAHIVIRVR